MSSENCHICNKNSFKYTCPRCNIIYCSVSCYKSEEHLKCSEEFYKECVQNELSLKSGSGADSGGGIRKIYEILKRMRETEAGLKTDNFDDGLDSDEEQCESEICHYDSDDDDEMDLAERLKGININNANEVWERLTSSEKDDFKKLVASGDIMKLLPDFKPWWLKRKHSKVIELSCNSKQQQAEVPVIIDNIPKFSTICSKEPALCLHYNMWNILAAYSCTVRFFNGEHLTYANEATAHLINLSSTLKYGINFDDADDAVISVEMEALTTGNGVSQVMTTIGTSKYFFVESRMQLKSDARQLMSTLQNKLSALSDILKLLNISKKILKAPDRREAEFQKIFALSSGMEEVTHSKVQQLIKKLQFYLSYVNREADNG